MTIQPISIEISRHERGVRTAELPVDGGVRFGGRGQIAAKYSRYARDPHGYEPHATTLDDVVACQVKATYGRVTAQAVGQREEEEADGCLVIRSVHVHYRVRIADDNESVRAKAGRAHRFHAKGCPIARTLGGCIRITTDYEVPRQ